MTNDKNEKIEEEKFILEKNTSASFSEWLMSEFFLPNKVVKKYIDALKICSRYSVQYGIISKSLFEISDKDIILKCKNELLEKPVFKKMNEDNDNLYGDVLDKYYSFIAGDDSIIYAELSKAESLAYLPKEQKDIEYIELEEEYKLSKREKCVEERFLINAAKREKKLEKTFSIKEDNNIEEYLADSIADKFMKYLTEIKNISESNARMLVSDVNTCSNFVTKATSTYISFFKIGEKRTLTKYMEKLFSYSLFVGFDKAQNNRCSIALQKYYDYICDEDNKDS